VQLSPGRNIDPTWYQVAYPKEIAPGETGHFELIFNIPSNAEVRAGDYEASVAVVAEDDIPAAVQNIQIKILSELDFDVNLQYNEVKQRFLRKTRNKLIIRNNSIQPERFTISIEVPDTLRVESQESTVELDAQQTREIPLSFHPRRSGERHQPYAIRVKPRFGAAKERSGIFVARRQKLPLPSLATVIFLLVMLALLLVLADQFLLDGLIREIVVEMLPFPFQLPPIQ
jgi:hypothetical protein